MKNFAQSFLTFFGVIVVSMILISLGAGMSMMDPEQSSLKKDSILLMEVEGVIFDSKQFVKDLVKYSAKKEIKGVLVRINSPGGVVAPSQEIYAELKRVQEELNKPVVASCNSMAASGAYYIAVAAKQIVANPGSLLGSIGVIIEFANMEGLYEWAKVKPYSISTGAYKDSGATHRPMRPDERALFQALIDETYEQFKKAVQLGRNLSPAIVDKYSDGRVFTGESAVKLGFADQVGTFEDAKRIIGGLTGLGDEPELYKPPVPKENFFEYIAGEARGPDHLKGIMDNVLKAKSMGMPMYILPSIWAQ